MKTPKTPKEIIRERVIYDPESGTFEWAENDEIAGRPMKIGYRRISFGKERIYEHHVAWMLMTGEWPIERIDHKDGNPANNSWSNLRACEHWQNLHNTGAPRHSQSGLKGAYLDKRDGYYYPRIKVRYKLHLLGRFKTAEEAHAAYAAAAVELCGEFGRAS